MDINTLRGIQTILVMIAFAGICWWAYSAHRRKDNEEAAQLPFADEDIDQRTLHADQDTAKKPDMAPTNVTEKKK